MKYYDLGNTGLKLPPIIFGTSCLGNLYQALPFEIKLEIMREFFRQSEKPVVLDTAGKYGAGLALEVMGKGLRELGIKSDDVIISNKLGWFRTPLLTSEPTFEPGAWKDLKFDAKQKISYNGILECWEKGCQLLGKDYKPQILSVHDPDEYLAQAKSPEHRKELFTDIIDAYHALICLKKKGEAKAIGVGAKDWKIIQEICNEVKLDWVMLAVSLTIYHHPVELLDFISDLTNKNIAIINSAVFNAGFLTGGEFFNYQKLDLNNRDDQPLFQWREKFFSLCKKFEVLPADVCVQFGMSHPGIISIALNTSKPSRVKQNVHSVSARIPNDFWLEAVDNDLISTDYPIDYLIS